MLYEIRMRTLLQGNLGGHDPKSRLRFFFVVSRETSKSSLNSMSVKLEPASPQDRIGIFTVAIFGQPTQGAQEESVRSGVLPTPIRQLGPARSVSALRPTRGLA